MLSRLFYMRIFIASIFFLLISQAVVQGEEESEYLYYRDVHVAPYQNLREFFDMPDRFGRYEVTLISESLGPLTFRILRAHDDRESIIKQKRSYHVGNHEFRMLFTIDDKNDDLIVELANSNPAATANISLFVVEQAR
ncbi:MAG: hypothetical protein R8L53_00765 [Mariprofundales bacterium]